MRKCAEAFFVDKLFIGTDGFSIDTGFTGNDYMRCEAVKDMARQASHVIIVTESDKFHQKGVSNLIDLHQVSCIYTDDKSDDKLVDMLHKEYTNIGYGLLGGPQKNMAFRLLKGYPQFFVKLIACLLYTSPSPRDCS